MNFSDFISQYRKYPTHIRYKGVVLLLTNYSEYKKLNDFSLKYDLHYKDVREFLKKGNIYLDNSFSENTLFQLFQKEKKDMLVNNIDLVLCALEKDKRTKFFQAFLKKEFSHLIVLPVLLFQDEANLGYEKGYGNVFSLGG